MARRKSEFRPDKAQTSLFSRLYLTKKQRLSLLKWLLYGLVLLVLSILQDVMLCRVHLWGATTALVPCGIFLICLAEGAETGSIFTLIASLLYLFSGASEGYYCVPLLTVLALGVTMFRQAYLRKGFSASMLCLGTGMILYELVIFTVGLVMGLTTLTRLRIFGLTALYSLAAAPILYPILLSIGKIGGETWKE